MGLLAKRQNKNGVLDILGDDWISPFSRHFSGLGSLFGDVPGLTNFTTNLVEEENSYVLTADMPGVNEDDIELTFDNNVLTVSCKQSECRGSEEGAKTHWQERFYGESTRRFRIDNVDPEQISAELSKGVLSVRMPKRQTTAPVARQIEIKTK